MPATLTPEQVEARKQYVLSRVRAGVSRSQIEAQFSAEFGVNIRQCRTWYNKAIDGLVVKDATEQRRLRASIIEMLHAQIAAAQSDVAAVGAEVKLVEEYLRQQTLIQEQLLTVEDRARKQRLQQELANIPKIAVNTKATILELKSRMRDRLVKTITELARIQGLYETMNWLQAVQVLANSEILPADVAERMLSVFDEISALATEKAGNGKSKPNPAAASDIDDDLTP